MDNIKDGKTFCMAPWVHIHNLPDGRILPCCMTNHKNPVGNLYQDSVETIWNNEQYCNIRKKMMNGEKVAGCERCYKEEEWGNVQTYRKIWNNIYGDQYKELVENFTTPDGFLNKMQFYRWDFRFSNLCNLACTTCGPNCSSLWVEILEKMGNHTHGQKFKTSSQNKKLFFDTIISQADIVDQIYFAGGEPLIQQEHYEILKHIDSINRIDQIEFLYSTNLTQISYKDQNFVEYWKKMKNLKILVSLDEIDETRLHYIRYPAKLPAIIENIKILNENLTTDKQRWMVTPTWNILNTHRIKNFVEYFQENDLFPQAFYQSSEWEGDIHNIILLHPNYLSISAAPQFWKEYLNKQLKIYEEWYKDKIIPLKNFHVRDVSIQRFEDEIKRFYNALNDEIIIDPSYHQNMLEPLDKIRKLNFLKTFPELDWYLEPKTTGI